MGPPSRAISGQGELPAKSGLRRSQRVGRPLGRIESLWIGVVTYVAYLGVLLLRCTARLKLIGAEEARARVRAAEPIIVAFWHDSLLGMPLLYGGGPLFVMTSWHRDGEIAARCIGRLGMKAVRGSSTRGWAGALRGLVMASRGGCPIVVVPDGPLGPRHRAKPGAVQLARATGAEIVPIGFYASRAWRAHSWDRMLVPLPFARAVFVQGCGVKVRRDASAAELEEARTVLEAELERASEVARVHAVGARRDRGVAVPAESHERRCSGERARHVDVRNRTGAVMALGYDALMAFFGLSVSGASRLLGRSRYGLAERVGRYPREVGERLGSRRSIWLHAASVGELQGLRALLGPLNERFPRHAIVVSTLTGTGRSLAASLPGVDAAVYFPLDARWIVRRALAAIRPELFVFTETELWPGFLSECAYRDVPCVLVSGRVSARSVRRYAWVRPLMRNALARVICCVQSETDARHIISVGAMPSQVEVSGNLKAEAPVDDRARMLVTMALRRMGVTSRVLIVGASTHHGEEAALLGAFSRVMLRCPEAILVVAPRHPDRFDDVAALLETAGAAWVRFSELGDDRFVRSPGYRVILLDSIGVLRAFFPFACLVFVGGTLVPVGGHNVLEPAAEGCAVVFGPHTDHVAEAARALLAADGARRVADGEDLARVLEMLVTNRDDAEAIGVRAAQTAAGQRGALGRHLEVILSVVNAAGFARYQQSGQGIT